MNKFFFAFLLPVLFSPHHHNSVMIVSFVFLFVFVPSKTVMISLGDDRLVMLEKTETFCSRKEFSFFSVRAFELILFAADCYANSSDCRNFS